MTHDEMLLVLRRSPFHPFALRMVGGERYEITHPDLVWIHPLDPRKRVVYIGLPGGGAHRVDLMHVAAIEEPPEESNGTARNGAA